tara:strand:- start:361 stop:543 length:183 start_codon:yes stop_codon:yes gene_type:complete
MIENMNITSAQYVDVDGEHDHITIIIDNVEMAVPLDPTNRHYAEILRQVNAGTLTIKDAE